MTHPPITQQITFIYTADLARAATFYEDVMGLSLWRDQGTCRIYHVSTDGLLGICQTGSGARGIPHAGLQTNVILTIVTDDVDAWYQHLADHGVSFEKAPETNPRYAIYHCFLRDPDGYLIEIQRFLDDTRTGRAAD